MMDIALRAQTHRPLPYDIATALEALAPPHKAEDGQCVGISLEFLEDYDSTLLSNSTAVGYEIATGAVYNKVRLNDIPAAYRRDAGFALAQLIDYYNDHRVVMAMLPSLPFAEMERQRTIQVFFRRDFIVAFVQATRLTLPDQTQETFEKAIDEMFVVSVPEDLSSHRLLAALRSAGDFVSRRVAHRLRVHNIKTQDPDGISIIVAAPGSQR